MTHVNFIVSCLRNAFKIHTNVAFQYERQLYLGEGYFGVVLR